MELTYIKQILGGDISKFSYLINTYKDMAYSISFRILHNKEDAEEAVQDSFLKAYKALSAFKGEAKFSTWLYKIVVNISINKLKGKKQPSSSIEIEELPEGIEEVVDSTYKMIAQHEQVRFINIALDELEMEDRLLLTLYYLNENTVGEVAEMTSITPENVKMKIHRARRKMFFILSRLLKDEN